jgi:hypothetical protein
MHAIGYFNYMNMLQPAFASMDKIIESFADYIQTTRRDFKDSL